MRDTGVQVGGKKWGVDQCIVGQIFYHTGAIYMSLERFNGLLGAPLFKKLPPIEMVPYPQIAREIIFSVRAYWKTYPHLDIPV